MHYQHIHLLNAKSTKLFLSLLIGALLLSNILLLMPAKSAKAIDSSFVTRVGTQLFLNGSAFRFAGANIYWLGLDEGAQSYPTAFRIDDAFTMAREMGLTVIRSHSLGVSTGCALCVEPTLGQFNETALQRIDYAIKRARDFGFKLIIPLTDNYHFYHGGKYNFTQWRGISDENQFYYSPTVINDFEQYVSKIVNRVNAFTGVAYRDDPTIMAWETGNELLPPSSWTRTIANYLRVIDTKHLIVDGNYGVDPASLSIPTVDIFSDHLYPPSIDQMNADTNKTRNANKAYIIGEFDWRTTQGTALGTFLPAVINNQQVSGDLFWSIWPHDDVSGYQGGNESINLNYPGDTADRRNRTQLLRAHGYNIRGQVVPASSVPGTPVISKIDKGKVYWRGTAVADRYTIERSTVGAGGPWTVICDRCVTDYNSPYSIPTGTAWYRLKAHNLRDVTGPYSGVVATSLTVDNLDNWNQTYSHTPNLYFDSSNADKFNGDTSRVVRSSQSELTEIAWKTNNAKSITAVAYFWPSEPVSHFSFYIADSTLTWKPVSVQTITAGGNWQEYRYIVNTTWEAAYVKIRWNNPTGQVWTPQLSQVIFN